MSPDLPYPISFNPFKHHLNNLKHTLKEISVEELAEKSELVCNNYIDIYTGHLSVDQVCYSIVNQLQHKKAIGEESFKQWLNQNNGYQRILIEDGSEWILRYGVSSNRYVHIHPSRFGEHTMRFKGSTLKTALMVYMVSQQPISLELINSARSRIGLSPIKKLQHQSGIAKCYQTLFGSFEQVD